MGNESIKNKFDDIEIRVDFLIELCRTLQDDNKILVSKVEHLEIELDKKSKTEEIYTEQESMVHSKMDGLLTKLDSFANNLSSDDLSNV